MLDGDFYLSETVAIAHYLAEKLGKSELLGKDLESRAIVNSAYSATEDISSL